SNLYMGTAALSERDWVHEAIDQADLIISIGRDTVEKPPFLMGHDGPQVIHVGATPATVEQVYFPQAEIVGDVGAGLASLAVCLDGGFMMNSQELETAVRLKLNLVVLVLEDRAYGMIRWKQEVDTFPDFGLEFGNPDFVAYAKSYGAKGWRVGKASELSTMLEAAFSEGGV